MNAYERLLAEELPTGTFGHAEPPKPGPRPWTALEQAEHHQTLNEALNGWEWDRETRRDERRHLRLIDTETDTEAA
ncbi:hypothetical protein [Streptomyces sp. NPDC058614]|uniref:hypothetical protein n=1 Tax=Streptomyces sp. NPDC058614 TaxID=3346557 RepID=UPI003659687F